MGMTRNQKVLGGLALAILLVGGYNSFYVQDEGTYIPVRPAPETAESRHLTPEEAARLMDELRELSETMKRLEKDLEDLNDLMDQYHRGSLKSA